MILDVENPLPLDSQNMICNFSQLRNHRAPEHNYMYENIFHAKKLFMVGAHGECVVYNPGTGIFVSRGHTGYYGCFDAMQPIFIILGLLINPGGGGGGGYAVCVGVPICFQKTVLVEGVSWKGKERWNKNQHT